MNRRTQLNLITSFLLEIILIVSGFVIPKLIMLCYGSEVNGLVQSITQFLSFITFFEAGVGSVIRFNLYTPLLQHDTKTLSRIVMSAERFFRKLAVGLLVYIAVLMIVYPQIVQTNQSGMYTALLIAAMCISSFAQYYWGQANQLLLTADQCSYVHNIIQIGTVILNIAACVILIRSGAEIQLVKLVTAAIYLLRPLLLNIYVKKHYQIDRNVEIGEEPIKQKWNGLAQHIAYVVLENTDVVVLSIFSPLTAVSVYSAYNMVVSNIKRLFVSGTGSVEAVVGKTIAGDSLLELRNQYYFIEWAVHTCATLVFGCTFVLILPFVSIYTQGVTDVNYYRPIFAMLLTFAHFIHTLRLPCSNVILSGGHYKQTQSCYIIAAAVNIIVSILLVIRFELVGVAIGTIVSMTFQNLWMAWFVYRKVLNITLTGFIKQLSVDIATVLIICLLFGIDDRDVTSYKAWLFYAVEVFASSAICVLVINSIFYKENIKTGVKTMFPSAYIRRSLRYHGTSPKTAKISNLLVRRLVTVMRGAGWALTHLSYYFHRERYFPNFELLLSRACPFDCKCCIHFIPEYPSKQWESAEAVLSDMKKLLFAVDRIDELVISGGDAFLYPELATVVKNLKSSEKIGRVVIVSSGDVSPDREIVQMLPDEKVLIKVDNYGKYSRKINEFTSLPDKSIRIDGIFDSWPDFGNESCRNRSEKELERQYASCKSERYCLLNGKIYACPRSAHGSNLGYFTTRANESVDVRSSNDSKELLKKIKELRKARYLISCNHCNGATEDFKVYSQDVRFKKQIESKRIITESMR